MNLFIPAACMLLLAGFFYAVLHPIFATRYAWARPAGQARQRLELTERKEQLYASLRELEFDHSVGKISSEDLRSVRPDLEANAVEVLRQLDAIEPSDGGTIDWEARVEADLAQWKREASSAHASPSLPGVFALCPSCGAKLRNEGGRFCPHCGIRLDAES